MKLIEEQTKINKKEFLEMCRICIKRDGIEDLLEWLEKTDFFEAPASSKYHGNHRGGLVKHSLNVFYFLKSLTDKYFITDGLLIETETVAIVSLFHDICKANFYKLSYRNAKNEETGKWTKEPYYKIDEEFPIGHGEKSCIILQQFLKLTEDELLAIRFHMGGFDSSVKGGDFSISKAYQKCNLAVLLHMADLAATYLMEGQNGAK